LRLALDLEQAVLLCEPVGLSDRPVGSGREAGEARRIARDAERRVIVSARSGEMEDGWLSDLAVGWTADLINDRLTGEQSHSHAKFRCLQSC
jgi:enolase